MKQLYNKSYLWLLLLTISLSLASKQSFATHAQGADISYQCLGGNQYQVRVSFYRDCAGVAAPNTVTVSVSSASCGQSFNVNLTKLPGTGQDVTPICPTATTQCSGGTWPGVQEYIYTANITLPMACVDWVFGFSLCCRNNAITTIQNPGGENIYVEAHLNNLNYPCDNAPVFSNPPVPYICLGQTYCFNHGATDADGDSLAYTLIPPQTSPNTTVNFLPGWNATQPLSSNPAVTLNPYTGDICMTPTQLEVAVMAVRVDEYRNGVLIGSVIRDIQVQVMNCTNTLPYLSGINNTTSFQATTCEGANLTFNVFSADDDPGQTTTLTWNGGIPGATFTTSGTPFQNGTFSWTPPAGSASTAPYCFTVTVSDNNCPFNGSQTFSYCITVGGISVNTTASSANCGASNGSASASGINGIAPYQYSWSNGATTAAINGLTAGNYTVNVTDAAGCTGSATVTIGAGTSNSNVNIVYTPVSCFGGSNGQATANVNGGQQPYQYLWSNGATTQSISGLPAGTYSVQVTNGGGCVSTDQVIISQPASPVTTTVSVNNVTCFGQNNGSATATPAGGTPPYTYFWNTATPQTTQTAMGLAAGTYTVVVTDANTCAVSAQVNITEPAAIQANVAQQQNVSCNGLSDGSATMNIGGGTPGFNVSWSTNPVQTGNSITSVPAGTYVATITDANNCQTNYSVTITEPQALTLAVQSTTDVTCFGQNNGSATVAAGGGTAPYQVTWSTVPALSGTTINNLAAGTYTATVTDAHNCQGTAVVTIAEPAPLSVMTPPADTICPGQGSTLYAYVSGGTPGYTYTWNNGLGNASTHVVTPATTTTYTVQVTDANGCQTNPFVIPVAVNNIQNAHLYTSATQSVCAGSPVSIYAGISNGMGNYTFTWNNGLGTGPGPFNFVPTTSANYIVTVVDECNNSKQDTVQVIVNPIPQVSLQPFNVTACGEANYHFTNTSVVNPGDQYWWSFGDGTFSALVYPDHAYTTSGTFNITVEVTSQAGCYATASTTGTITVYPQTEAFFDADKHETGEFDATIHFMNTSSYATSYQWDFAGQGSSNLENPFFHFDGPGTYPVTLITNNQWGCADTTTLDILVYPEYTLYVPNAFTPDGDGTNDVFYAQGQMIEEFEMLIFDRWGENIFQANNLQQGWDGTYRSQQVQEGVYVYKIKVKDNIGRKKEITGSVTLIR